MGGEQQRMGASDKIDRALPRRARGAESGVIESENTLTHPKNNAPLFSALGDPCRLSIIERLCEHGPLPTIRLTDGGRGVSRQGITKHLRVLEDAGLVESFRVGKDRLWQVRVAQLATLRAYLDQIAAEWDARLKRLKLLVEDNNKNGTPAADE